MNILKSTYLNCSTLFKTSKPLLPILSILTLSMWSGSGNAAVIDVTSSANNIAVGQTFNINFKISGLSSSAGDSLSGFDIDLNYDNSIFSFVGSSFLDPMSASNQLDLPEAGAFPFAGNASDLGNGKVDAFGLSGNSSGFLDSAQQDQFNFLSLTFKVLASTQSSNFGIDLNDPFFVFLDSSFNDLPLNLAASHTSVSVSTGSPSAVPLPNSFWLFASAGLLLVAMRKKMALQAENLQLSSTHAM